MLLPKSNAKFCRCFHYRWYCNTVALQHLCLCARGLGRHGGDHRHRVRKPAADDTTVIQKLQHLCQLYVTPVAKQIEVSKAIANEINSCKHALVIRLNHFHCFETTVTSVTKQSKARQPPALPPRTLSHSVRVPVSTCTKGNTIARR